jgi:hypothetical protein
MLLTADLNRLEFGGSEAESFDRMQANVGSIELLSSASRN